MSLVQTQKRIQFKAVYRRGIVSGLACAAAAAMMWVHPVASAQDAPSVAEIESRLEVTRNKSAAPDAQQAAMRSVVKMGPGAIAHLGKALAQSKRSWPERTAIAWILGEIGHKDALVPLKAAWELKDAPGTFRVQVAISMGGLGEMEALRGFLAPEMKDSKILVAKAAVALANLRDFDAVEQLKPWVNDPDIGPFIAMSLGRLGDDSGKAALKEMLTEPMFRDYAAVALGNLGDKTVLYPLRFALANPDPFIRRDAVRILERFKDKESLKDFKRLASEDPDPRVREAAERAAKRVGRVRRR